MASLDVDTAEFIQFVTDVLATHPVRITSDSAMCSVSKLLARVDHAQAASLAKTITADPRTSAAVEKACAVFRKQHLTASGSARLLVLVLIWLMLVAAPFAPSREQAVAINESTTVGLALAVTDKILNKRGSDRHISRPERKALS